MGYRPLSWHCHISLCPPPKHSWPLKHALRLMTMTWKQLIIAGCMLASPLAHAKQHTSLEKAVEYSQPSLCYFTPPSGWDIADPSSLSPRVKIAFLKSTSNGFCPSINLAIEETSVSLSEYLKAVK